MLIAFAWRHEPALRADENRAELIQKNWLVPVFLYDAPLGFEPRLMASKATVLPLDDGALLLFCKRTKAIIPSFCQMLYFEVFHLLLLERKSYSIRI